MLTAAAFAAGSQGAGPPVPPASDFSARVDNPWFPLAPGSTYVYTGIRDGKPARDVLSVTRRPAAIDGVPCVVVDDRLYLTGRLAERTTDWYTQDRRGNVWYFGEQTAELDARGRVTGTKGTWRAGVDGARPGIYMPARPKLGQTYQQEYYAGQAEDQFEVAALFGKNAVLTREWTRLDPGVIDEKLYVRGVGTTVEGAIKGGDEHLVLQSLRRS
jgi:hypothetical protein